MITTDGRANLYTLESVSRVLYFNHCTNNCMTIKIITSVLITRAAIETCLSLIPSYLIIHAQLFSNAFKPRHEI